MENNKTQKTEVDNSEKGLVKTILILVIVVFVISYWKIDMKALLQSETTQNNFSFIGELLGKAWEILKPIWNGIWEIMKPAVKEGIKSQL